MEDKRLRSHPVDRFSSLPAKQRQQLIAWSSTRATDDRRDRCVHQLFEAQAERTPDATALVQDGDALTYAALNRRANQLARHLRSLGVGTGDLVGVCLERPTDMVTSLLAVLKAGGGYLALDPSDRADRLASVAGNAALSLVIGRNGHIRMVVGDDRLAAIEPDWNELARHSPENLECHADPNSLAYVIYTSGSTGEPKGVEVLHRGIVRLVTGLDFFRVEPADVFLQLSSVSFDLSTFEIWHPLLHGAGLALFPGRLESFEHLAQLLKRHRVTCLWLTASLFNAVIDECPQALSGVRELFIGGEALSVPHVQSALRLLPSTRLINGYGPTEATTFTHCYPIPRDLPAAARSVPIGRPIAGTDAWILDTHLNPVPIGAPGELYVGGDGLARGYRHQPALTAKSFMAHPFTTTDGARLYRTGDRARYLPDGLVEFLGRSDNQVKVRGFRVELEGIEATLIRHPALRQAAVLCERGAADARLTAYVVFKEPPACLVSELRRFLESALAHYMVPSRWVVLDALPLTSSGKVDRQALAKSERPAGAVGHARSIARTATERVLTTIWADLFQVETVGIDANFFEIGGHSLIAARLFARIEQSFGRKLPLSTLLRAPTIEQLAAVVEQSEPPSQSALVPIQPHGRKRPLFCVSGIGGSVLGLATLGRHLGDDQPVFGLRPAPSDAHACASIEVRAARYVEEILTVAPHGPYRLAGYSSGGILAFEMARQLTAEGHQVALLAIFDQCPLEQAPATIAAGPRFVVEFLRNLPYWFFDDFLPSDRGEMFGRLQSKVRLAVNKRRRRFARADEGTRAADIRDVLGMWQFPEGATAFLEAEYHALTHYVPKVYPGRITLFRARAGPLFRVYRSDMGWSDLAAGGVDIRSVPGSHSTMLTDPHVRVIAEHLTACLAESAARTVSSTAAIATAEM
ncbi:MAG: hypothetical protein AUI64_03230 [Acidobacteria bacterium 13_1_40CM_2_64_6]|nr:MAG: hypothetical protein AUI64_03230 [Acidobacteria bacterium 13_1_40CM_2_64_6]